MRPLLALVSILTLARPALPDDRLNSVAWMQTSVEYRAASLGAFRLAARMLEIAVKDRKWSAALEQTEPFGKLPPAVILDADETVLDNSPFQARMIRSGVEFQPPMWDQWVRENKADAVPGAVEFCRLAAGRGVSVFFITNREHTQEEATRRNLERLGFPLAASPVDAVLTRGEKPDWTTDKGSRRRAVAERYRILLVVGDDLGDFLSGVRVSPEARAALARAHQDRWGSRWIMIPNPAYGSWEDALFGHDRSLSPEEKGRRKLAALREAQ